MRGLRFTLLADGSSDRALVPILRWLLREKCGSIPIQSEFADLRRLRNPPRKLPQKIRQSVQLYPCDLLFVHRDAERETIHKRVSEIRAALGKSGLNGHPPAVCVVPVRMQEAWLLIDETALRHAAGNPNGRQLLNMPKVSKLETLPNPKESLHNLLRQASGSQGHRRKKRFDRGLGTHAQLLAERIPHFRSLRQLAAFRLLEDEVERVAKREGWANSP